MSRRLTDEQIDAAYAEGMEAAHCGLRLKDIARSQNGGRRYQALSAGYWQGIRDREESLASVDHYTLPIAEREMHGFPAPGEH